MCPSCGYEGLYEPPWSGDSPSDEICPCCAIQFGYDDYQHANAEAFYAGWRARWVKDGKPWFSQSRTPPEGWSAGAQLRNLSV